MMNLSEGAIEVRAGLNKHVLCGLLFDIKLIQERRNETRSLVLSKAKLNRLRMALICVRKKHNISLYLICFGDKTSDTIKYNAIHRIIDCFFFKCFLCQTLTMGGQHPDAVIQLLVSRL